MFYFGQIQRTKRWERSNPTPESTAMEQRSISKGEQNHRKISFFGKQDSLFNNYRNWRYLCEKNPNTPPLGGVLWWRDGWGEILHFELECTAAHLSRTTIQNCFEHHSSTSNCISSNPHQHICQVTCVLCLLFVVYVVCTARARAGEKRPEPLWSEEALRERSDNIIHIITIVILIIIVVITTLFVITHSVTSVISCPPHVICNHLDPP